MINIEEIICKKEQLLKEIQYKQNELKECFSIISEQSIPKIIEMGLYKETWNLIDWCTVSNFKNYQLHIKNGNIQKNIIDFLCSLNIYYLNLDKGIILCSSKDCNKIYPYELRLTFSIDSNVSNFISENYINVDYSDINKKILNLQNIKKDIIGIL